jgi:putative acetyltransferase
MKVRPYEEADLESVVRLFTASVHGLAADHYDAKERAAWAPESPDLEAWRSKLGKLDVLVAEGDDGKLLGFIGCEGDGHVDLLFTAPEHARKGVASGLYQGAEAQLATSGVMTLYAEVSLVARPFFESQGFQLVKKQVVERAGVPLTRFAMRKVRGGVG